MNTKHALSATQLQSLSHEGLVNHLRSGFGDTSGLTRSQADSFYVRDERVPAARVAVYPKRRATERVRAVVLEPSYADFLSSPALAATA